MREQGVPHRRLLIRLAVGVRLGALLHLGHADGAPDDLA